jgi:hypothetical protein
MVGQGIVFRQTTQPNGEVRTWGLETMYIPTLPSLVNGTAMQQSAEWISYGDETGTLWTRRTDGTAFKSIYRAGQEVIPGVIVVKQLASSSPGPAPLRYADCVHSVDHRPVTKDFAATIDKLTIEQIRGLLLGNPSGINRNEREYLRVQLANVGVLTTSGERDQFMKALEALGFPSIRLAIATAAKYGIPLGRYATIVKRSVPHMLANAHRIEPKRQDRTVPKQKPPPFSHFGIDTIGDFPPSRFGGHKKALVFMDYGTGSGYIIGMRDTTVPSLRRAASIFVAYAKHDLEQAKVARPELTLGPNLTSDGEKGLRHDGFNEVFASNGFEVRRYGAPYASWFNGKVEKYIGHVLSTAKAITAARAVPPDLWIDLLANAVSLLDLRPTKGNPNDECPYIERTRTQPTQAMQSPHPVL